MNQHLIIRINFSYCQRCLQQNTEIEKTADFYFMPLLMGLTLDCSSQFNKIGNQKDNFSLTLE